uniref:Uncharacterized protein n=1 Tax=Physcomitrium patens TaxID=3218 RepID=A0A2K1KIU5_PHYPA|nr:hypothetical protein PHYPA_007377 [Physcomitrium patens]
MLELHNLPPIALHCLPAFLGLGSIVIHRWEYHLCDWAHPYPHPQLYTINTKPNKTQL